MGLNVSTTKAIINKLTGTVTLGYNKEGDADAKMDFNIIFSLNFYNPYLSFIFI